MSTASQWARARELFDRAIELEPGLREGFVHEQCAGSPELRKLLDELLEADQGLSTPWPRLDLGTGIGSPPEVPGYEELELVGHGGMGSVYRARRQERRFEGQIFAIKVLHAHRLDGYGRLRFAKERRLLALLDHPNVVRILDGGELEDGRPFLVTDLVEGEPLDRYCRKRRLSIEARLQLFHTFCGALHYAHQNLIVHRDIKPSNLLIDSAGVPHLLDFGIAKLLDDNATQTSSRFVPFTPGYASPEQVAGRPVSISSDIYSAGLLLFELLTDQLPSRIESLSEPRDPPLPSTVISEESVEVARDRRTTVGRLRQRLRGDLDEILAKALRWQPEERYGSARELAEDIERHLRSLPILARKGSRQYRIRRFVRRHRLGLLALVSGLAILGFATAAGVQSWRLARQGEETVAMIRELAGPDSSHLMDTGSLDRAVEQILSLDSSQESKSLLLALLNRVNIPEEQLLLQSNRFFAERAASGTGDPRTAELGLLLGEMLFHGGYFEAAEGILADSVEIARQAFGARSAALPEYLEMHARVLAELERYEEGIEALNLSIRLRGESAAEAIRQAEPQYQLSCLHYLRGSFIEAAESGRRALEILDRNGGGESGFRSQVLKALAVAWIEVEPRDGAAIEMAREAVEIDLDRHGPHHMETIQARHNLAMVLARGGRIEEALGVAEENLRLAEIGQGADHPRLGYILSGMAQGYQAVGRPENCVEVARRAVEIRSGGLPPGSFLTAASQMRLASCLVDLGQFDEAEELLQTSIQTFEQSRVQNGARLAEARAVLAKLKESKVNAERYPAP